METIRDRDQGAKLFNQKTMTEKLAAHFKKVTFIPAMIDLF